MATLMRAAAAPARTSITETRGPVVLAIVVTHRGRRWLKDCLVALASQTYDLLDVLVVDDASPDYRDQPHLKRIVKRHLGRLRWGFLRTRRPLGFGGAINWALSRVRTDADYLLFLHDDASLDSTAIERMVERMAIDRATAIVGPKIVSWDDSQRLEEVGMAIDRFGYPYKGLEDGEIDLGQHDDPSEVFYVTSTCMLIRHEVFRQLKGWDAHMRAFSEDLDLCWRARLAGYIVKVEPRARARHAIALATGQRSSRFQPTRYFIRRNRLRTVAKNVAPLRLLWLLPQFLLLAVTEMIAFVVLRQPGQIVSLVRALGWNLARLPQTLAARARVQRIRTVPDRRLRRLTVRESTRVRSYVGYQAERLEEAWGRRTEFVQARGSEARAWGRRMSGIPALLVCLAAIALAVGARHVLWAPQIAVGELLPFPERAAATWQAFFSPWQSAGLGQPGPTSPGVLFLGTFPVVTFGAAGAAQKLLLLVLGVVGWLGAAKLTSELVDRPSRWIGATVYVLGGVGYAGLREGALGALVFAAMAPFVLHSLLRLTGWIRPSGFHDEAEAARLAAAAALAAAFVPGSLLLFGGVALLMWGGRALLAGAPGVRSIVLAAVGLVVAWGLLLPWSLTWWTQGGPLQVLGAGAPGRSVAAYQGEDALAVLVGRVPDVPPLFGLALPLLGGMAVLIGRGQRRRAALCLWLVVAAGAVLVTLTADGVVRPLVATPTEAGVIVAAAFSGLTSLAVGAFRLDLPRRGLGLWQPLTLGGLASCACLLAAGLGPALWAGAWEPARASGGARFSEREQITSVLESEVAQDGAFRTLWVGSAWRPPTPSAIHPREDHVLTGPRGELVTDLFERGLKEDATLTRVIASIEQGATDRAGRLLGAFNIRFVALARGPGGSRWTAQRDLAVVRSEPGYLLLANETPAARAGLYRELPANVVAARAGDAGGSADEPVEAQVSLDQVSPARFKAGGISGPGLVFLAETHDTGWRASLGDDALRRAEGGWGNAWVVPTGASGEVSVAYPFAWSQVAWFFLFFLAWLTVLGAAFSEPRPDRPLVAT